MFKIVDEDTQHFFDTDENETYLTITSKLLCGITACIC